MNVLVGIISVELVTTDTLFLLQKDLCGADYPYQQSINYFGRPALQLEI